MRPPLLAGGWGREPPALPPLAASSPQRSRVHAHGPQLRRPGRASPPQAPRAEQSAHVPPPRTPDPRPAGCSRAAPCPQFHRGGGAQLRSPSTDRVYPRRGSESAASGQSRQRPQKAGHGAAGPEVTASSWGPPAAQRGRGHGGGPPEEAAASRVHVAVSFVPLSSQGALSTRLPHTAASPSYRLDPPAKALCPQQALLAGSRGQGFSIFTPQRVGLGARPGGRFKEPLLFRGTHPPETADVPNPVMKGAGSSHEACSSMDADGGSGSPARARRVPRGVPARTEGEPPSGSTLGGAAAPAPRAQPARDRHQGDVGASRGPPCLPRSLTRREASAAQTRVTPSSGKSSGGPS